MNDWYLIEFHFLIFEIINNFSLFSYHNKKRLILIKIFLIANLPIYLIKQNDIDEVAKKRNIKILKYFNGKETHENKI